MADKWRIKTNEPRHRALSIRNGGKVLKINKIDNIAKTLRDVDIVNNQ